MIFNSPFKWIVVMLAVMLICFAAVNTSHAYRIDADFLNPDAMVFPVGRMLPGDLSNARDINFANIDPIFWMQVQEDNLDDPDMVRLFVRLEVSGGNPIFTVSSRAVNIRQHLIPRGRMTNQQLAQIPQLGIGEGDQFNSDQLFPYLDGGMMREGLYILTVVIADENLSVDNWNHALNNNYGIYSATLRTRIPGQVILTRPDEDQQINGNPVFSWVFPRRPGVEFRLQLVSGDPEMDPSDALNFASANNRYLDKTITLGPGSLGEITSYNYTGTGEERNLDLGKAYYWRVTATAPTMFPGEGLVVESIPRRFYFRRQVEATFLIRHPRQNYIGDYPTAFHWSVLSEERLPYQCELTVEDRATEEIVCSRMIDGYSGDNEWWTYIYGNFGDIPFSSGHYRWHISARTEVFGRKYTFNSNWNYFNVTRDQVFTEMLAVSPADGAGSTTQRPTFTWSYEGNHNLEECRLHILNSDMSEWQTYSTAGDQRSRSIDDDLRPWYSYKWYAAGLDATGDIERWIRTEYRTLFFPKPQLKLEKPGEIASRSPTFEWVIQPKLHQDCVVSYRIIVNRQLGKAMGEVARAQINKRNWKYKGQQLVPNTDYYWEIEARITYRDGSVYVVKSDKKKFTIQPPGR